MKPDLQPFSAASDASEQGSLSRDRIGDILEERIVSGALKPGMRLDERALAEEFNVSRTPVRDAIGRLASIGLIEVKPRSGSYIAQLELGDILHLFELMSDLEGLCARYAAQRIELTELAELRELAQDCETAAAIEDPVSAQTSYSKANFAFHDMIYSATKNPYLESVTRQARRRCSAYRSHTHKLPGRMAKSVQEHFGIVDAIEKGDAEAAFSRMRQHVDVSRNDYAPFIRMLSQRSA